MRNVELRALQAYVAILIKIVSRLQYDFIMAVVFLIFSKTFLSPWLRYVLLPV